MKSLLAMSIKDLNVLLDNLLAGEEFPVDIPYRDASISTSDTARC